MIEGSVLRCDHAGCAAALTTPRASAAALRKLALDRGWSRSSRGGDLCPGHREPGPDRGRPAIGPAAAPTTAKS